MFQSNRNPGFSTTKQTKEGKYWNCFNYDRALQMPVNATEDLTREAYAFIIVALEITKLFMAR